MLGPSLRAWSGCGMGFDEQTVGAGGQGRPGQHRRKFALARRLVAAAAGQLHGMRGVENTGKPNDCMIGIERMSATRLL